jgi:hypothetical protein
MARVKWVKRFYLFFVGASGSYWAMACGRWSLCAEDARRAKCAKYVRGSGLPETEPISFPDRIKFITSRPADTHMRRSKKMTLDELFQLGRFLVRRSAAQPVWFSN